MNSPVTPTPGWSPRSRPGRRADPLQRVDFYLPIYARAAERLARIAPMTGRTASSSATPAPRSSRRRSSLPDTTPGASTSSLPRRLPRPDLRRGQPDRVEDEVPRPLRAAPPRHLPRAVRQRGARRARGRVFHRLVPADEVAAIIVEPVQGEGGIVVPDEPSSRASGRSATPRDPPRRRRGPVGAGRTGKMWAIEHWGVKPDILVAAKGLASGMPIGAMVAGRSRDTWGPVPTAPPRRQPRCPAAM